MASKMQEEATHGGHRGPPTIASQKRRRLDTSEHAVTNGLLNGASVVLAGHCRARHEQQKTRIRSRSG